MKPDKKKTGIIMQVATLFVLGMLITGLLTYFTQRETARSGVRSETESIASNIARETELAVKEYPAYEWLISFWYDHSEELDIEYDVTFEDATATEKKAALLESRHPGQQIRYLEEHEIRDFSEEDQKLYAEVMYSWLITRINMIKSAHDMDYLFAVIPDQNFEKQFFLFSAGEKGAKRGREYEEVYTLGTTVSVGQSQQEAMREAVAKSSHLADAGSYMDFYQLLTVAGGKPVLIGLTYDLSSLLNSVRRETIQGTVFSALYQFALMALCLLAVYYFVLRPLQTVERNINLYTNTKDSAAVIRNLREIRSRNEIGALSRDVIRLAGEIDSYVDRIETITAEKERIGTELSLATRIQGNMLPNVFPAFPSRSDFDIYASMDPAREVGGDFYDFFLIDDNHLCIEMADVSGKGVPAALFMMASKIILANNAMMGKKPSQVLADTNTAICSNNRAEMFVTVWLGILEISTGILTAANAGHEYPIIRQPGGRFEILKDRHGFVLGGMPGMKYTDYTVKLEPGSALFLYTDGLPEATGPSQEMFTLQRVLDVLNRSPEGRADDLLFDVRVALDEFVQSAEQYDDLTMLCMQYFGPDTDQGKEITVPAKVENLEKVTEFVNAELQAAEFAPKEITKIDIVIDEVFSNISFYAYTPDEGDVTVCVKAQKEPRTLTLTFTDRGIPFNPTEKEDPDITLPAGERDIGGLGIMMIRKLMDDVKYERREGENILILTKKY